MKKIIDCSNGEVIERDLTENELTQQAIDEANSLAEKATQAAEAKAKAEAKAQLLDRLGITEDEAKLLLA